MPAVTIDGRSLFYTVKRGPPGAPVLLLIHGAAGSHLDWPAELRRLGQARVVAIDLPGHGRSAPPSCHEIPCYAAAIQGLVEHLPPADYVLAGHSMGGAIALEIALQRPAWLRGLVLIGAGAHLPVNPVLIAQATTDFPAVVAFLSRHFWSKEAPPELIAASRRQLAQTAPEVLRGDFLACDRFDRREEVAQIDMPALVIASHGDRMMPYRYGEYLAQTIPQAELLSLEGAGHMMMLEQAEQVAGAVGDFVALLTAR
jgi:pimeloyl-ACP methyl ester carboxylesterase